MLPNPSTTKIILGICGSIAAYKTPELIRLLLKEDIAVIPLLTRSATEFVTKITLGTVSGVAPSDQLFDDALGTVHIQMTQSAQAIVIAPATANMIAKLAVGIADDLISTVFLAFNGPRLIVPAMNTNMYKNQVTQENIQKLKSCGVQFLGPQAGSLACGDYDLGRLVELPLIVNKIKTMLLPPLDLSGHHIVITSGGTCEPMDAVRHITNQSTGKMGQMLAHVASFCNAKVTLISTTPLCISNPGIETVIITKTVAHMQKALQNAIASCSDLIMAAAVSDFTVQKQFKKIKRQSELTLKLIETPDLLLELAPQKGKKRFIGFCLEDHDRDSIAKEKLKKKSLDYIIANTSDVIGQDTRSVKIFSSKSTSAIELKDQTLVKLSYHILKLLI